MEDIVDEFSVRNLVAGWLAEDMHSFDFSLVGLKKSQTDAKIFFKSKGVCAGFPFVTILFQSLNCKITWDVAEGSEIKSPRTIATVHGPTRQILRGERVALNILCRASGVATLARSMVTALQSQGWHGRLAGTRKTTPGFRMVEKYAMMVGGADTHRYSLSAMVMLKDNHIYCAHDVTEMVAHTRQMCGFSMKIEVECSTLETAEQAAVGGADIIMFDNPTSVERLEEMTKAFKNRFPHVLVEVSGSITPATVTNYALSTVDIISTSSLCQGYPCCDISLKTVDMVDGRLVSSSAHLNEYLDATVNKNRPESSSSATDSNNGNEAGQDLHSRSGPQLHECSGGGEDLDAAMSSPSSVDADEENEKVQHHQSANDNPRASPAAEVRTSIPVTTAATNIITTKSAGLVASGSDSALHISTSSASTTISPSIGKRPGSVSAAFGSSSPNRDTYGMKRAKRELLTEGEREAHQLPVVSSSLNSVNKEPPPSQRVSLASAAVPAPNPSLCNPVSASMSTVAIRKVVAATSRTVAATVPSVVVPRVSTVHIPSSQSTTLPQRHSVLAYSSLSTIVPPKPNLLFATAASVAAARRNLNGAVTTSHAASRLLNQDNSLSAKLNTIHNKAFGYNNFPTDQHPMGSSSAYITNNSSTTNPIYHATAPANLMVRRPVMLEQHDPSGPSGGASFMAPPHGMPSVGPLIVPSNYRTSTAVPMCPSMFMASQASFMRSLQTQAAQQQSLPRVIGNTALMNSFASRLRRPPFS